MQKGVPEILIVGHERSGKTSVAKALMGNLPFNAQELPTTEVQWYMPTFTSNEQQSVPTKIWDIPGKESYILSHSDFINKSDVIILTIDLSRYTQKMASGQDTWDKNRLIEQELIYANIVLKAAHPHAQIKILGTKTDLASENGVTQDQQIAYLELISTKLGLDNQTNLVGICSAATNVGFSNSQAQKADPNTPSALLFFDRLKQAIVEISKQKAPPQPVKVLTRKTTTQEETHKGIPALTIPPKTQQSNTALQAKVVTPFHNLEVHINLLEDARYKREKEAMLVVTAQLKVWYENQFRRDLTPYLTDKEVLEIEGILQKVIDAVYNPDKALLPYEQKDKINNLANDLSKALARFNTSSGARSVIAGILLFLTIVALGLLLCAAIGSGVGLFASIPAAFMVFFTVLSASASLAIPAFVAGFLSIAVSLYAGLIAACVLGEKVLEHSTVSFARFFSPFPASSEAKGAFLSPTSSDSAETSSEEATSTKKPNKGQSEDEGRGVNVDFKG